MSKKWEQLQAQAIHAINKEGVLLVYPMKNKDLPLSLWQCLYPKKKMEWAWDESADSKVSELWILREQISRTKDVVYSKWYQGRATFFSKDYFVLFRSALKLVSHPIVAPETEQILEILRMDSPLSTKQLKKAADLQGRLLEPLYNRAMKPLWQDLSLVGRGELDEGAFPSLLIGSTTTVFEDLQLKAQKLDPKESYLSLLEKLGPENLFMKYLSRLVKLKLS